MPSENPDTVRVFTGRPLQIVVAVAAVLVLVVSGIAWRTFDSFQSGLSTVSGLGLGNVEDGALDILMVGTDSRTDAHGNPLTQSELDMLRAGEEVATNTDTIILIRIPSDGSSATAISIPRDAYVQVPGIGRSKINAAYGATKETERQRLAESGVSEADAERESTQAGRQALIDTVANLTGVEVDHYAEVGLLGFVLLTNAVGGVDVCLNNAVEEPLSGASFPAGEQTLDGPSALSFVRQRHDLPRGDLDRIVRQQVFMSGLVRKVLSARTLSDPAKLGELTRAVNRSVVLDSDWDVVALAQQMQNLTGGAVQFATVPVVDINATTDYGESVVQVDPGAVRRWVAGLLDGDPTNAEPADSGSSTASTATTGPSVPPSQVTVSVANAGGVSGLASQVSDTLGASGYTQGEVGNYETFPTLPSTPPTASTVFAADADSAAAQDVARTLGGLAVEVDTSLPEDAVTVALTADYTGPTSASEIDGASAGSGGSDTSTSATDLMTNTSPTPAPASTPIDAGGDGPRCVN